MKHSKWIKHRARARRYKKPSYWQRHINRKTPVIRKMEREAFANLSRVPKEYGGKLDFDKNKELERFTANVGTKWEVIIPDFEAVWHTHPPHTYLVAPSPIDIAELIDKKNQAGVAFRGDEAFVYAKKKEAKKKLDKLRTYNNALKYYKKAYQKLFEKLPHKRVYIKIGIRPKIKVYSKKEIEDRTNKEIVKMLTKEGFYAKHIPDKNTPIKMPVEVVE